MKKSYMIIWVVLFLIIGIIVYIASGYQLEAVGGVALAAALSFIIMFLQLRSQWSGIIETVKQKEEAIDQGEESGPVYETKLYAYVRLDNGKKKRVPADPHWKPGDRLVKKRGETGIHLNPDS